MHTRTYELLMSRPHARLHEEYLDFAHMLDAALPGSRVALVAGIKGTPGARYRVEARLGKGAPRTPSFTLELIEVTDTTIRWASELQGDGGEIIFELTPQGADSTRLRVQTTLGRFDSRPELEPVAQAILGPAFQMMRDTLRTRAAAVSDR